MRAFTMNHLSTEQINLLNDKERDIRHHQYVLEALHFIVEVGTVVGSFIIIMSLV